MEAVVYILLFIWRY